MTTERNLSEDELYEVIEAALKTKEVDTLKLAELASGTGLSSVERTAQEPSGEGRPVTGEERGKAFRKLIKQAIERLRPTDGDPDQLIPEWNPNNVLYEEYVLGMRSRDSLCDSSISARTILHRRKVGVKTVVTQLSQWGNTSPKVGGKWQRMAKQCMA